MKIRSRAGIADPPNARGRRRTVVAALVAAGLAGSALVLPGIAAAAVPTFPDNVVVFPDRDFVTIEGYQDHVGQTATVESGGAPRSSARRRAWSRREMSHSRSTTPVATAGAPARTSR